MARRGRNAEPEVGTNEMLEFMRGMMTAMQQQAAASQQQAAAAQEQVATLANIMQQQAAASQEQAVAMREQAAANAEFMRQAREEGCNNDRNRERIERNPEHKGWKDFLGSSPPTFEGEYNPKKALRWIEEMEELFDVFHNTDAQKVSYGTYMLKGDAERWWKGAKSLLEARGTVVTWDSFKVAFLEKYFPKSIRAQKEMEFMSIRQGDTPFEKFLAEYEDLAEYSSMLKANPDEAWKCTHFVNALNPMLHKEVSSWEIENFATLVNKCLLVIASMARLDKSTQQLDSPKRKQSGYSKRGNQKDVKGKKPKTDQDQALSATCPKCGRFHGNRPCLAGTGNCYKCGKPGHVAMNCPPVQKPVRAPRSPTVGRVYMLKGKGVAQPKDLTKG